ncbi:pyruvate dehydrogenase (acetyl-transferring) E1 component subunit alpha [Aestuariimicrobium sp. p3-SID1156]|uniref:pyruvate dehydrogenase (acetyl-transferring) E1 component subunit alpha n=1 Tax=Aestuariimicrobium sp. p3-SID1156 TaxID=2916038 RepID=UPI00223B0999|nr:pyruvate dehydrogenase (acetyl-transferring) E1 component subunit alpha [Aestuariimicrobium sp. p3-SID1156]MCT1458154.1 pyruvate dehydrogenase (acetyl-transferring) E1 component subunit alpha [Aestuariimicrobium sp. p3-SID1156]
MSALVGVSDPTDRWRSLDPSDMVQLLTPEGERVEHPDFSWQGDAATLRGLLRDMVLARRFDAEGTALQRHGELGLWPPLLGQEAAQAGAAAALRPNDFVFPSYREHGVALAMGVPVSEMLKLWRGTGQGDWNPQTFRFNLYTLVIGSQTLHATGYAMGLQLDGAEGAAVLAFHGDGASSQGDVNEAYVFAASYHAPVVFFCQNNQWAISEPTHRQTRIPLYQRARGFGFPGIRVDGNDVLAVQAVTEWAMARARRGEGPAFIEAFTYRMGAHTTSDDPTKYRLADEDEHWRGRDPIERVKTYLASIDELDQAWLDDLDAQCEDFGADVRRACHGLEVPDLATAFDRVHAEQTHELRAQKEQYVSWAESFA